MRTLKRAMFCLLTILAATASAIELPWWWSPANGPGPDDLWRGSGLVDTRSWSGEGLHRFIDRPALVLSTMDLPESWEGQAIEFWGAVYWRSASYEHVAERVPYLRIGSGNFDAFIDMDYLGGSQPYDYYRVVVTMTPALWELATDVPPPTIDFDPRFYLDDPTWEARAYLELQAYPVPELKSSSIWCICVILLSLTIINQARRKSG